MAFKGWEAPYEEIFVQLRLKMFECQKKNMKCGYFY